MVLWIYKLNWEGNPRALTHRLIASKKMFWINVGIAALDNCVLGEKIDYYHHQAIISIPHTDLFHEISKVILGRSNCLLHKGLKILPLNFSLT